MKQSNGYFIPYAVNNGEFNMDFDEKILDFSHQNQLQVPVLRFYGWAPACVSLGRNQSIKAINTDYCTENGIDVVRRLTGGRALLHDNELTYSFVCPISFLKNGESIVGSYKEISGALALGFQKLGIDANFPEEKKVKTNFEYCMSVSTGADLSFKGRKIVGSAQYRKQGYILQHGSIVFDYDTKLIENIFGEKPMKDKIITMNEINIEINKEKLANAIKQGVKEYFAIQLQDLNEEF